MSVKIIQDRLDSYNCKSELEEEHAIREITQEVALAALGRTDFFKYSAFQGGTCLRIFYGLNRFSEDMDFILKNADDDFALEKYLKSISEEVSAYGYGVEIVDRSDTDMVVKKVFFKDDSLGKLIQLNYSGKSGPIKKIRIKFEVDSNPPQGSNYETKHLDFPFVSSVVLQDVPSLFAGKIHALLTREYIKGRDWYDFIWYTSIKTDINFKFLSSALNQQGPWQNKNINVNMSWCVNQLKVKIESINWKSVQEDIRRFVKPAEQESINIWNRKLLLSQLDKLN
ncbi:nucleotidyl transferase AbiEii/AbiGii toxin family protein [Planctomycetota bacterium]